jgi:hypothetical protein
MGGGGKDCTLHWQRNKPSFIQETQIQHTESSQNPSDQEQNKFYKITSYLTQTQAMIAQNARF